MERKIVNLKKNTRTSSEGDVSGSVLYTGYVKKTDEGITFVLTGFINNYISEQDQALLVSPNVGNEFKCIEVPIVRNANSEREAKTYDWLAENVGNRIVYNIRKTPSAYILSYKAYDSSSAVLVSELSLIDDETPH